ncbi:MAG: hypothetical protein M3Y87_13100 [Myxococcota bacterium]|nr:hypothetical protein [Myxococcota bacterium]
MIRNSVLVCALLALALSGCCMGGGTTSTGPVPTGTAAPVVGAAPIGAATASVTLAPGFLPDPATSTGTAGGPVAASTMNPMCRGHITAAPNLVLNATGAFPNLRVIVSSQQDTTLVVQHPDGSIVCDDDGGESNNPLVTGPFAAGQHRVWIGSYSPTAVGAPFTLGFSELESVTALTLATPGGGVAPSAPGAPITIAPGFLPDPQTARGVAGGPVSASTMGPTCRGYITATPSHVLTTTGAFTNLRVIVSAQSDTTLVIQRSDGTVLCDDDSEIFNPIIEGAFPPGVHNVFVGTYSAATAGAPYTVGFTELGSVTAASLAGGM